MRAVFIHRLQLVSLIFFNPYLASLNTATILGGGARSLLGPPERKYGRRPPRGKRVVTPDTFAAFIKNASNSAKIRTQLKQTPVWKAPLGGHFTAQTAPAASDRLLVVAPESFTSFIKRSSIAHQNAPRDKKVAYCISGKAPPLSSIGAIATGSKGSDDFAKVKSALLDKVSPTERNVHVKIVPGKLRDKSLQQGHLSLVKEELGHRQKVMIAQVAPAVRVSLGEEFGYPPGTKVTGKTVAALKKLGFDYVFDVLVGADLTIVEEATELLNRLRTNLKERPGPPLPMFTSCCPGWVSFVEKSAPELIPHLSTAKSPHMMEGTLIKEAFSMSLNKSANEICVVSIMPCVRKQGEADRLAYQTDSGARHVDHVLTTVELGKWINDEGIDFALLPNSGPDATFDPFMGIGTGAGAIFGVTGGVMEAALRSVVEFIGQRGAWRGIGGILKQQRHNDIEEDSSMPPLEFKEVRGFEGIKEATVSVPANPEGPLGNVDPLEIRVAIANGLGNAKKLIKGPKSYHFVEVMACPGGCIGGGGQPHTKDKDALGKRKNSIYEVDERCALRRSHENPVIRELYQRVLGEPGSARAEELLHTKYAPGGG